MYPSRPHHLSSSHINGHNPSAMYDSLQKETLRDAQSTDDLVQTRGKQHRTDEYPVQLNSIAKQMHQPVAERTNEMMQVSRIGTTIESKLPLSPGDYRIHGADLTTAAMTYRLYNPPHPQRLLLSINSHEFG